MCGIWRRVGGIVIVRTKNERFVEIFLPQTLFFKEMTHFPKRASKGDICTVGKIAFLVSMQNSVKTKGLFFKYFLKTDITPWCLRKLSQTKTIISKYIEGTFGKYIPMSGNSVSWSCRAGMKKTIFHKLIFDDMLGTKFGNFYFLRLFRTWTRTFRSETVRILLARPGIRTWILGKNPKVCTRLRDTFH